MKSKWGRNDARAEHDQSQNQQDPKTQKHKEKAERVELFLMTLCPWVGGLYTASTLDIGP